MSTETLHHHELRVNVLCPLVETLRLTEKPVCLLSDFDYTLCHRYHYDALTKNHTPVLDPQIVRAVRGQNLIVATGRRAENPAIPLMWESGLVDPTAPIITENGGVLVFKRDNELEFQELTNFTGNNLLRELETALQAGSIPLPVDKQLVIKRGRTLLVVRVQSPTGELFPEDQAWLAEKLKQILKGTSVRIVNTRASVTLQSTEVNKQAAFTQFLEQASMTREELFVLGLGDGENDQEIFSDAQLSLGFSEEVRSLVDIDASNYIQNLPYILQVIRRFAPHSAWPIKQKYMEVR